MIGEGGFDRAQRGMQFLHHRQRLPGSIRDHVSIRESIFRELPVEDLDLELERGRIRRAPKYCLLLADARISQTRVADAGEVVPAEHVAELVLVAEFLIPVGAKEKVRSAHARPPRLLEVVVEVRVASDERGSDASAHRRDLTRTERAGRTRQGGRIVLPGLDSARRQEFCQQLRSGGILRDRHIGCGARAQREREQAFSYVLQYLSSIGNGCYPVAASAVPAAANRS